MNDTCTYEPTYVDASHYQPLPEEVYKPPGLSLSGSLDTIVEETEKNNAVDTATTDAATLLSVVRQLKAEMDDIRNENAELKSFYKTIVGVGNLDNERSQILQNSRPPPPIPPMPKQSVYDLISNSRTSVPLVNRNSSLVEGASITNYLSSTSFETLSLHEKFDANMNLSDRTSTDSAIYQTAYSFPPVVPPPQTATYPSFNFSNPGASTIPPQVPSSFNFTGTSPNDSRAFKFVAPKWEPQMCKKFEVSLETSVKNFFERIEKKHPKSKVSVASTNVLPDSNPFKVDLDKNVNNISREIVPPPLPPRSSAMKPWDYLTETKAPNQWELPATKSVYEAAPVFYDTSSKVINDTSSSDPVFTKREDPNEFFRAGVASNIEVSSLPSEIIQTTRNNETLEERNLRLFNESFSSGLSKISSCNEITTTSIPTNAKSTTRDPPPLPPRTFTFDFNTLSQDEQTRYTDWLISAQYSENFTDDESLARSGWKRKIDETNDTAAGSRPVSSTMKREIKREESIDRESSVKSKITATRDIAPSREAQAELEDANPCQFKPYQMSENRIVYIFNLDNEGWLPTEEFAAAFTNLHALTMVNIVKTLGVHVPYRTLSRTQNLRLFEKLERTSLGVSRDENNKIGDILHLMPLRSSIKVLRKLKFITDEEVRSMKEKILPEKSSIFLSVITLIQEYAKFQLSLQTSNGYSVPM